MAGLPCNDDGLGSVHESENRGVNQWTIIESPQPNSALDQPQIRMKPAPFDETI